MSISYKAELSKICERETKKDMLDKLRIDLKKLADPRKAKNSTWFFKTKVGEYGYGDQFIGITVPESRKLAAQYKDLTLDELEELIKSPIHEERLIALFILVLKFKKGDQHLRQQIYEFYLAHTKYVNNWDLVDSSAAYIVGHYLIDKDRTILIKLAKSEDLWEKRISIISTHYFIRFEKSSEWTFKISEILLQDKHDLIHKAVGWMLREVGKNISHEVEEKFLDKHYKVMPRTMLRYAIEHFELSKKAYYMAKG